MRANGAPDKETKEFPNQEKPYSYSSWYCSEGGESQRSEHLHEWIHPLISLIMNNQHPTVIIIIITIKMQNVIVPYCVACTEEQRCKISHKVGWEFVHKKYCLQHSNYQG